jgi:hypothetical protein
MALLYVVLAMRIQRQYQAIASPFQLVSSSIDYAFSKRLTLEWDVKRKASE